VTTHAAADRIADAVFTEVPPNFMTIMADDRILLIAH
jgi:hypothetical protein